MNVIVEFLRRTIYYVWVGIAYCLVLLFFGLPATFIAPAMLIRDWMEEGRFPTLETFGRGSR